MTTQAHPAHLDAAAGYGRAIACADCHAAATAATHADGTVNLVGLAYTGGDLAVTAKNGGRGFPTPDGYIAAVAASRAFIVRRSIL